MTLYSGLSQFYFRSLLRKVIQVGNLGTPGSRILDFGCGNGELKRLLPGRAVVGYDIQPALSEVPDWRTASFDLLVANEVFYCFPEDRLEAFLGELKARSPKPRLVVGISRQGWLNKLGMFLLGKSWAHSATLLPPARERAILMKHCRVTAHGSFWGLADVYSLEFL